MFDTVHSGMAGGGEGGGGEGDAEGGGGAGDQALVLGTMMAKIASSGERRKRPRPETDAEGGRAVEVASSKETTLRLRPSWRNGRAALLICCPEATPELQSLSSSSSPQT